MAGQSTAESIELGTYCFHCLTTLWMIQVVLVVKNPPAHAGDRRDAGSIPESGRSPGGGHGNSLQYSCLENPMDRGACRATVHEITKSQRWLSTHAASLRAVF